MSRRHSIEAVRPSCLAVALCALAACSSAPTQPTPPAAPAPAAEPAAAQTTPLPQDAAATPAAVPAPAPIDLPPRAVADFDRAVNLLRAGNSTEAELEFKQLAAAYPQFAGPQLNLGLLYRKGDRLEEAEAALKAAVERNGASAIAWNELGVTLRMRGKFTEAATAYERAIAADPNFAPAHRNLGVLADLYLGDSTRALAELERYKELSGEEKPVSGWIAELKQRAGK